jgi:polysaccharide biosynthesis transport protein
LSFIKPSPRLLPNTVANQSHNQPPNQPLVLSEFTNPGLSLAQIGSIVWAYRKQTIAIAAVITLATAAVVKFMPKSYVAQATMMVNTGISETGQETAVTSSYVSTQVDLMQSPEVLGPVVERFKLTENDEFTAGYRGDGKALPTYVQQQLAKQLVIRQGDQANQLIYLEVTNRSPNLAADITNAIGEVYIDKQRGWITGPANTRAKEYTDQLNELQSKVKQAQDQVTAYRQKTGTVDTKDMDQESLALASLEQRLQEAQSNRRAVESKTTDTEADTAILASGLIQDLKTKLADQEAQLAQLKTTLGPQHPKIVELVSQIGATQRSLESEVKFYSKGRVADLAAARQLEQKTQAAVNELRTRLISVGKVRDDGAKFELELQSAQAVYKRALEGYDQIMFASGRRDANVTFVSRAVPPANSVKPNKIKLLIMGMLSGLFLGLAGPFAYEFLIKRVIRCRDDFERDLGLPVLAELTSIAPLDRAA